jgi:hypothetical protein
MDVAAKLSVVNAAKARTQVLLTMATGKNVGPAKPSELSATRPAGSARGQAGSLLESQDDLVNEGEVMCWRGSGFEAAPTGSSLKGLRS